MTGFTWFLCIVVCFLYPVDGGTTCLSCSSVESVIDCTHLERCGNNEICFAHKYVTESKSELYDFGCTYQKLCVLGSSGSIFGKRLSEGHHIVCQTCCNDTDICNMKSSCVTNVANTSSTGHSTDSKLPRECDDLTNTTTGVYTIYPDGIRPTQVYCIMANNEKWTVIQRRFNCSVDFYQDWMNYKKGFGPAAGEYWLGNDNIHTISTTTGHKLSIYLEDFNKNFKYANYSYFHLGDEHRKYQLTIGYFSATAGLGL
ncbi:fibrinogen-like protein A [Mytilus galloprovincialis]|uniref:fibrinogen-like protein A n=1 Tax=Mytilus galloprovincialis TaxID=29158 RepID=UPI003F7BA70A